MKSNLLKAAIAGFTVLSLAVMTIAVAPNASAQTNDTTTATPDTSGTTGGTTTIVPVPVSSGLGGLGGNSSLGNLFVLSQLFNSSGSGAIPGVKTKNLGDLLVLSQLFGGTGGTSYGGSTGSILGSGGGDIGNLFLLNRLFATQSGHSSVFSGSSGNLGDYIILNSLFR